MTGRRTVTCQFPVLHWAMRIDFPRSFAPSSSRSPTTYSELPLGRLVWCRNQKSSWRCAVSGVAVAEIYNLRIRVDPEVIKDVVTVNGVRITLEDVTEITGIDPWFVAQMADLVDTEKQLIGKKLAGIGADMMRTLKRKGFSDARIAELIKADENALRRRRIELGVRPVFKRVDTCAAEFATTTAYLYSTYEEECESDPTDKPKIMILGGGPNRIGQGIEFDYCCVHAALALRESGY